MTDLFPSSLPEKLPVPDADLVFWRSIECGDEQQVLEQLIAGTPWKSERIRVWGKTCRQPRLTAWYGDDAQRYAYSGITLHALPLTPLLQDLRRAVEQLCGCEFNSVLLNYYRDQRDSMGLHSDDEPELGPAPAIASLSFGAPRRFVMKHRTRRDLKGLSLVLPPASVLLMRGPTQANWKHGIPRQAAACGPRVNLTFRRILPRQETR